MKLFKWEKNKPDIRICGAFNGCPLQIARACIKDVWKDEALHVHPKGHEFYVFVKGRAEIMANEKTIKAEAGDIVMIEPGEKHKIIKILEETDYIVVKNNPDPSDKQLV